MRKIATLLLCLFFVQTANAQTYTQMQWGLNRGVTPYAFGANINGTWRDLGTVSAAGVWNITFTPAGAGAVATTIQEKLRQTVSVIDFGATPDNNSDDDAPAFRNAIKSNRNVIVPPGVYTFKTLQAAPCCAAGPPAVRVTGQSNFKVSGPGAVINMDSATNLTGVAPATFIFDEDTNFEVEGFFLNGNKTGLTASQENAGFLLFSIVAAHFHDLHFGTGWGGIGAPIVGDWFVNSKFDHIVMDTAGICADVAYLKNVTFSDIIATGADFGQTGAAGNKCFSNVIDLPNAARNFTGVPFTFSDNVLYHNNTVSNFSVGAAIASGTNFRFHNNYWIKNPGIAPSSKGIGIYVYYLTDAVFSSAGFPPQNITIDGDVFKENGATVSGAGVFIDPSTIANSDTIKNISVINSSFENNTNSGIITIGTANASNFFVNNNTFFGAAQTVNISDDTWSLNTNVTGDKGGKYLTASNPVFRGVSGVLDGGIEINNFSASNAWKWHVANSGGGFYVFDKTNNKFPLMINPNSSSVITIGNSIILDGPTTLNNTIKLKSYTVSTLPACNSGAEGFAAYVTDATSPTYNATLTGGGAVRVPVFCNGTNWTAH